MCVDAYENIEHTLVADNDDRAADALWLGYLAALQEVTDDSTMTASPVGLPDADRENHDLGIDISTVAGDPYPEPCHPTGK